MTLFAIIIWLGDNVSSATTFLQSYFESSRSRSRS